METYLANHPTLIAFAPLLFVSICAAAVTAFKECRTKRRPDAIDKTVTVTAVSRNRQVIDGRYLPPLDIVEHRVLVVDLNGVMRWRAFNDIRVGDRVCTHNEFIAYRGK